MSELVISFIDYTTRLPWLELIAMLLSLAYIILAAKGSLWCWPAAFISTAIYSIIFYDVSLLMDSALNIYYLVMAIYGYWVWQKSASKSDIFLTKKTPLTFISWSSSQHIKACFLLTIISFVLGYIMANHTSASFPYLDTFTTIFAVFTTYLVTQKVLENWLYWIVIDFVSIYLYIEKELLPTAILFAIYIVIAIYGYIKWRSFYQKSEITSKQIVES